MLVLFYFFNAILRSCNSLQKRRVVILLNYLNASYVHNEMCLYNIIADWFVILVLSNTVSGNTTISLTQHIYNAQLSLYILISQNVCVCVCVCVFLCICLQIR